MAIAFLNNIAFSGGAQAQSLRLENLASDPASGNAGQLYFNSDDIVVKVYDGTAWIDIASSYKWNLAADSGTAEAVNDEETVDIAGGTYITTAVADPRTVTITHADTTRSDTTSTDAPGYGGTFDTVTSVTTNDQGHVTAIDVSTVTLPSAEDYTWTLTADSGTPAVIYNGITVDVAGGTNISTVVGSSDTVTVNLNIDEDIPMNSNSITGLSNPTEPQDAATKSYVDELVTGGLQFKGTFDASTGEIVSGSLAGGSGEVDGAVTNGTTVVINELNGSNATAGMVIRASTGNQIPAGTVIQNASTTSGRTTLTFASPVTIANAANISFANFLYQLDGTDFDPTAERVAVEIGDYYVATTAGDFYGSGGTGTCSSVTPLTIGDSVIAVADAAADSSDCADWSIVQGDEGVVDLTSGNGVASTGSAITSNTNARGAVTVQSFAYDGGTKVGHVPSGGSATTFLKGNGSWAVPDKGSTGIRRVLTSGTDGIARSEGGGITTFSIDLSASDIFDSDVNSLDVMVEVVGNNVNAGETVYAEIARTTGVISIKFLGSVTNSDYQVLLNRIGGID